MIIKENDETIIDVNSNKRSNKIDILIAEKYENAAISLTKEQAKMLAMELLRLLDDVNKSAQDKFIDDLRDELKNIEFVVAIEQGIYLEINNNIGETFIDFDLEIYFSPEKLINELINVCTIGLEEFHDYDCNENDKNTYNLLFTTILKFLTEKND